MYIRLVITNYTGLSSSWAEIITDILLSLVILGSLDRQSWKHTGYRRAVSPLGEALALPM